LIDRLPEDVTWEELEYHFYVRNEIEKGLEDIREGRLVSNEEVCKRLGVEL